MGKLKLVAGGSRASETMPPEMYHVRCVDAQMRQRGRHLQVILTFEVAEQAWDDGTALKQWYNLKSLSGHVSPHTKYAKAWELAAGRALQAGDDMDPGIFIGKVFEAYVGYSSQSQDGSFDLANAETRKSPKDFLRVHRLEKLIGHMGPDGPINTGVGGGGGGERSISTRTNTNTGS